jgi:hypothetical protein
MGHVLSPVWNAQKNRCEKKWATVFSTAAVQAVFPFVCRESPEQRD